MRFGLFCSPKADAPGFSPETGQGFRDFIDFNIRHSEFSGFQIRPDEAEARFEEVLAFITRAFTREVMPAFCRRARRRGGVV